MNIHKRIWLKSVIRIAFILILTSCGPKMCPLQPSNKGKSGCMVRMRHYHGGELYRGLPWYRKQNLRYGEKVGGKKDVSKRKVPKNKRGKKFKLFGKKQPGKTKKKKGKKVVVPVQ
ncbi:MAG: hypothetical protein KTR26_09625 [Flammeovirgaceae bacterium]|nr:hypothetical protein [Flammeovirgaceae bacterium]